MKRIKRSLILCIAFAVVLLCALLLCSCDKQEAVEPWKEDPKAVYDEYLEYVGTLRMVGVMYSNTNRNENGNEEDKSDCKHSRSVYQINKDTHILICYICKEPVEKAEEHDRIEVFNGTKLEQYRIYSLRCNGCRSNSLSIFDHLSEIVITVRSDEDFRKDYRYDR